MNPANPLGSYLDVLQVYFDQADFIGFRQQLNASDAGELCEGSQYAQLVVDHLTHPVARSHQQGHHRLPVLELKGGEKSWRTQRERQYVKLCSSKSLHKKRIHLVPFKHKSLDQSGRFQV